MKTLRIGDLPQDLQDLLIHELDCLNVWTGEEKEYAEKLLMHTKISSDFWRLVISGWLDEAVKIFDYKSVVYGINCKDQYMTREGISVLIYNTSPDTYGHLYFGNNGVTYNDIGFGSDGSQLIKPM